eukprot:1311290-Prymnesium_polylepis.1
MRQSAAPNSMSSAALSTLPSPRRRGCARRTRARYTAAHPDMACAHPNMARDTAAAESKPAPP